MPEANGEVSNEFFRKLNQQIVQKDNLIKLLQLQIKNMKLQIESGLADGDKLADLQDSLNEKAQECQGLMAEIEQQKQICQSITEEKDKEIADLNRKIAEGQTVAQADPRIDELETQIRDIQSVYEKTKEELDAVNSEKCALVDSNAQLQYELGQASQQIDNLNSVLEVKESELKEKTDELYAKQTEIQTLTGSSAGMEADNAKALEELNEAKAELEEYRGKLEALEQTINENEANYAAKELALSTELEQAKAERDQVLAGATGSEDLKEELDRLRQENRDYTEVAMKLTVSESEREKLLEERDKLTEELEKAKTEGLETGKKSEYEIEIASLQQSVREKEDAIADLKKKLEASLAEGAADPESRNRIEVLSSQVGDYLVKLQRFETEMAQAKEQLATKDAEISNLQSRLNAMPPVVKNEDNTVIPVEGESDVISSFIDFFDGLDAALVHRPDPELQALHKKLMERLIIPNKITYMPVISESFDDSRHYATTYFKSDKFPEGCVVFEEEKGYTKDKDVVIKKAKVWVVQNLYKCPACGVLQTNAESRFCHLCGEQIKAPNGLPVEQLPTFEPNAVTYQKFAESMINKEDYAKAKEYLTAGIALEPNNVPLNIAMADILTKESEYDEAMKYLKLANGLKPDSKTQEKIANLESRLSILAKAKELKLSPEEYEKLLLLIQK